MSNRIIQISPLAVDPTEADRSGPDYPDLGERVAKLRRRASTPENDRELGQAILEAIYRKNNPRPPVVEVPPAKTGKQILAAIRAKHSADLARALADDHRARKDEQVGIALQAALAGEEVRGLVKDVYVAGRR